MIGFQEKDHQYFSLTDTNQKWLGVTTLLSKLKEPFNREQKSQNCSIKKPTPKFPNKWYGIKPEDILQIWDNESKRSTDLGRWYHKVREDNLSGNNVYLPVIDDGIKIAGDQKLLPGIYPEHLCYLQSASICGQADYVEVTTGNQLIIHDYKTNKEISTRGWKNYEGIYKKLMKPIEHIEDCHLNHYALQLSFYAYIILRHNPLLTLKELIIEHVKFEIIGEDQYGYPIAKLNEYDEPIVLSVDYIPVPYLEREVKLIIGWLKSK